MVQLMECEMPPDLMDDIAQKSGEMDMVALCLAAENLGYTEEQAEWNKCLRMANGDTKLAHMYFMAWKRAQEPQEA